ncbi:dihydroxyacetone kinase subunit DhaL [Aureimonas sp. AU40]|uniref:dihydroxyacetone kinase subunit DhaL n=1 Tax=Aureimonas sp. AU40 TaxID=1637747 RepID=UPI00078179A7|nr:dihydroxyacetone kinase subunit DhaL [Aureimonas sp. AU40]
MEQTASNRLAAVFAAIRQAVEAEKTHLSELDGPIGDADHGTTMALGFRAVDRALSASRDASPSVIFAQAAAAFLDAVGASTGPLYATGFRRAAQRLEGRVEFGPEEQVLTLEGIAGGIAERGKAQRGDKTMLDVWLPAAEAARAAFVRKQPLWPAVIETADRAAEATGSMVASRGRAARLGERSLGHLDPGAVSAALILRAMAGVLSPAA